MYIRILLGFVVVAVLAGLADAGLFGPSSLPGMADLPGLPYSPTADTTGTTLTFPTPTPSAEAPESLSLHLPSPTPAPRGRSPHPEPAHAPHAGSNLQTPNRREQPEACRTSQTAGPVANADANLRSGPGTNYERIGTVAAGEPLVIVAQTAAGDWYQLESGAWIAAFLVDGEPGEAPVVVELPAAPEPEAPAVPVLTEPTAQGDSEAPAQATPATTGGSGFVAIGEEVEGRGWRFKVSEVHKRKAVYLYKNSYVAMGHFLIVIINAVNLQSGTDYFDRNVDPYVIDDSANAYFQSSKGTWYATWQYEGLATSFTDVNPGNFVRIAMAYDLPDGIGEVRLSTALLEWFDLGNFDEMPVEE